MCACAGMGKFFSLSQLHQHQQQPEEHVILFKAEVLNSKFSWSRALLVLGTNMAVKLYVYPREETACQHEFKTNSKISSL